MNWRESLAAVVSFAVAIVVLAGTIDEKASDDRHVRYGKQFPFVAKIACRNAATGSIHSASCVIISPRCVVTAAHVVAGGVEWFVTTDDGSRRDITDVAIHPDYDEHSPGVGDLAVCRVKEQFRLDFYPPLHAGRDEEGKVASIAGHGLTGTHATGAVVGDGRRRAGSNVIDSASQSLLICSVGPHRPTELEYLIASGDSGGGLFIGNDLAGINSFIMASGKSPQSKTGEESAHTRISTYKDWIETEVAKNE